MKLYLFAFITLLISGCVFYKNTNTLIADINKLPFSSSKSKCIFLKSSKDRGLQGPYENYYYFFPEQHIYMWYKNEICFPQLGYYDFEVKATDSNSYLYLEGATKSKNNIHIENKYLKKSLDSIYIHFKLSTIAKIAINKTYPITVSNLVETNQLPFETHQSVPIDSFSVTTLVNRTDSTIFIIALKKDSNIKKLRFFVRHDLSFEINIDEQYNYYEITASACTIYKENLSLGFWDVNKKNTIEVKPLMGNSYEFSEIYYYGTDSPSVEKTIYTWQDKNSLDDIDKEITEMLPTFIKILECSGTYPRK